MEQEHFFQCPYCWEEISMILDSSVRQQTYIEDCEVCCNPIEISPTFEEAALIGFNAQSIEQ
ncbi:CPXCG motif-containing cysteine-rich protein [uncultured Polaribacter sp.]|uniref:CPXCG motif-containing cysteine-rich protein n=1 Tax=uncultured Polaribacter sp. TaxID=174711 RepID=UPI00261C15F4|nr:CPXCG motif-containing cysteine-rich protein [uncultured Polaribacter sp.]